jgi:hypothetical protein
MVSRDYFARWRATLGLTLFGALCVMAGASIGLASPSVPAILITSIAACVVAPLLARIARGRFDPFEPLVVFCCAWGAMFVIRPLAMIAENDFTFDYSVALDLHETFDKMLVLALLGAIAFLIGYFSAAGPKLARRAPSPPSRYEPNLVLIGATVVGVVGLLGLAALIHEVGGLSQLNVAAQGRSAYLNVIHRANVYLAYAPVLLVGATLIYYAVGLTQRSWPLLAFSGLCGAFSWFVFNQGGSRGVLIPLLTAPVIFYYLTRARRPRALTLLIGVTAALFISTVIADKRDAWAPGPKDWPGATGYVAAHPSRITDPILHGQDNGMAPALAAALQITPREMPHKYGLGFFGDLFTRPIPRQLWSGKPLPPREQVIERFTIAGHANQNVNPEFSNLLVFYMDWGLFGALALVAYGIAARALYEWFRIHSRSLPAMLIFAMSVPLLLSAFRDSGVDFMITILFMLGPIWLVFALGRNHTPREHRPVPSKNR